MTTETLERRAVDPRSPESIRNAGIDARRNQEVEANIEEAIVEISQADPELAEKIRDRRESAAHGELAMPIFEEPVVGSQEQS